MSYRVKLLLLTMLPVVLIAAAILFVIQIQAQRLEATQESTIQTMFVELKQRELENYVKLAKNAITPLYNSRLKTRRQAQNEAKEIIRKMSFGEDNYFFIYDGEGTNIVNPRWEYLVGANWIGLQDVNGQNVIEDLINIAKAGGNFYDYTWQKPSSREYVQKMGYATYFDRWNWVIGTGIYMDDVDVQVHSVQSQLHLNIVQTKIVVITLAIAAVLSTAIIFGAFQYSEQRHADSRLKKLTAKIVDIQEDERKRVSRELHDGIGQLLVSSKYGLETAIGQKSITAKARHAITRSMDAIDHAISEVRRVSRALRPSALDDMGLAAAIKSNGAKFQEDTGVDTTINADAVNNLLSDEAKTALYRITQEALTNVAKHANATSVSIYLRKVKSHIELKIIDDGIGVSSQALHHQTHGLGIRNMQERVDNFKGLMQLSKSTPNGLTIKVHLPIETDTTRSSI